MGRAYFTKCLKYYKSQNELFSFLTFHDIFVNVNGGIIGRIVHSVHLVLGSTIK